jgi:hypothetical protein
MQQMARNATGDTWGFLEQRRYALHDRDTKFCSTFRATLEAGGIQPIELPARRRASRVLRHPAWEFTDFVPLSFRRAGPAC